MAALPVALTPSSVTAPAVAAIEPKSPKLFGAARRRRRWRCPAARSAGRSGKAGRQRAQRQPGGIGIGAGWVLPV
jgi:hypothetical protein